MQGPSSTSAPTLLFDKFHVLECWKKDAVSAVYLAHHIFLDIAIVLKTLDLRNAADPALPERFKREARLLARLDHPNIIKVLDFGTADPFLYISFEYFPAQSLRWWLSHRSMSEAEKIGVFAQTAQALAVAHQHGVLHRDIKPENILVNETMLVKLADFGLAQISTESRVTEKSAVVGTPGYLSPEQIHGQALTPASDLFALGIVGYELFLGANPFIGPDVGATINNILNTSEDELFAGVAADEPIRGLLSGLLKRQPELRLSAIEAVRRLVPPASAAVQEPVAAAPAVRIKPRVLWLWVTLVLTLIVVVIINTQIPQTGKKTQKEKIGSDTLAVAVPEQTPERSATTGQATPARTDSTPRPLQPATSPVGYGLLYINCRPWAEVHIDNKKIDTTPLKGPLRLYAGSHELALVHPDYPAWRHELNLEAGQTATVNISLDKQFGFFLPMIHPWGEVYVDEEQKGLTPFAKPVALQPGAHRLKIINREYGQWNESVDIKAGDTLRYSLDLNKVVAEPLP